MKHSQISLVAVALAIISTIFGSCTPESVKNRVARKNIVSEILEVQTQGDAQKWEYALFVDTVKEVRYDSVAVKLSIELANAYNVYRETESSLEALFPEGETKTKVGCLNGKQLERYKELTNVLSHIIKLRRAFKERIKNFEPSASSVIIAKVGNPPHNQYFFFNSENQLVSNIKTNESDSYIRCTTINDIFNEFSNNSVKPEFHASVFQESINKIDEMGEMAFLMNSSTPVYINRYVYHPVERQSQNTYYSEESSPFPAGANLYVAKKQTFATTTRDGFDRLIEYANANDLSSIDNMVVNGEVAILNEGEEVMMLDRGILVSKFKNKNGYTLFVESESLLKKD